MNPMIIRNKETLSLVLNIFINVLVIRKKPLLLCHQNMKEYERGRKSPLFLGSSMLDKKKILELAQDRINELDKNVFVVDLTISSSNVIHLEIDAEDGFVTIDDCVRVSRNIEHNLDREAEDFELSVSSAGLDKPLRHWRQYPKNVGRELKIRTSDGQKIEGKLTEFQKESIVLEFEEVKKIEGKKKKEKFINRIPLNFEQILEAKVVISFKK